MYCQNYLIPNMKYHPMQPTEYIKKLIRSICGVFVQLSELMFVSFGDSHLDCKSANLDGKRVDMLVR